MCSRCPFSVNGFISACASAIVFAPNTQRICMARPKSSPLVPHMSYTDQIAPCESCRQAWLVTRGARRVIASEARSAHGDAEPIDVGTLFEPVDAFADWYFAI